MEDDTTEPDGPLFTSKEMAAFTAHVDELQRALAERFHPTVAAVVVAVARAVRRLRED